MTKTEDLKILAEKSNISINNWDDKTKSIFLYSINNYYNLVWNKLISCNNKIFDYINFKNDIKEINKYINLVYEKKFLSFKELKKISLNYKNYKIDKETMKQNSNMIGDFIIYKK